MKKKSWGPKTYEKNGKTRKCTGGKSWDRKRLLKEEFVQLGGRLGRTAQLRSILQHVIWAAGHKEEQCTH